MALGGSQGWVNRERRGSEAASDLRGFGATRGVVSRADLPDSVRLKAHVFWLGCRRRQPNRKCRVREDASGYRIRTQSEIREFIGEPLAKYFRVWFRSAGLRLRVPIAAAHEVQSDVADFRSSSLIALNPSPCIGISSTFARASLCVDVRS